MDKTETVTEYWSNGKIMFEHSYLNGKYHGMQKSWYENGNRNYECSQINEDMHGLHQKWFEDGRRMFVRVWKNDSEYGPKIDFRLVDEYGQ